MKICILTETYYPVMGGGETQARSLARRLQSHGYSVCLVTRRSGKEMFRQEMIDNLNVYRVPPSGSGQIKKWSLILTVLPTLIKLRDQYDLILVSGYRILGIPALIVALLYGKVCLFKADSLGEHSGEYFRDGLTKLKLTPEALPIRIFLTLRNRMFERADAFIAISSQIEGELLNERIASSKIFRIPNSVDTQRFLPFGPKEQARMREQLNLPSNKSIIIYTGRLVSYKGLFTLIRSWDQICQIGHDVLLLLVGSGGLDIHNCEAELKKYVEDKGLEANVRFTGNVDNVHEYLQASDIFVFPTENEAFGISLIEAMACGLPSVSTQIDGVKEILLLGEIAIPIEPRQEKQLRKALILLLEDKQLRQNLGNTARKVVVDFFSEDAVFQSYFRLFLQIEQGRKHAN